MEVSIQSCNGLTRYLLVDIQVVGLGLILRFSIFNLWVIVYNFSVILIHMLKSVLWTVVMHKIIDQ